MKISLVCLGGLVLAFGGCAPKEPDQEPPPELLAFWRWIQSEGGFWADTVSPATEGVRRGVVFRPNGTYTEYVNGRPNVSGRFSVREGFAFSTGDTPVQIIEMDESILAEAPSDPWLAIRELNQDTLVLFSTHSEASYHMLVRAEAPADLNARP